MSLKNAIHMTATLSLLSLTALFIGCGAAVEPEGQQETSPAAVSESVIDTTQISQTSPTEGSISANSVARQQTAAFIRTPTPQNVEAAARQKETNLSQQQVNLKQQQVNSTPEKEVANNSKITVAEPVVSKPKMEEPLIRLISKPSINESIESTLIAPTQVAKPIQALAEVTEKPITKQPIEVVQTPTEFVKPPIELIPAPTEDIKLPEPEEVVQAPAELVKPPIELIPAPTEETEITEEIVLTPTELVKPPIELIPAPAEDIKQENPQPLIIGEIPPEKELRVVGDFLLDDETPTLTKPPIEDPIIADDETNLPDLDLPDLELSEPVLGSVLLGWDQNFAFNTGELLEIADIDGFEIAYGQDPSELSQTIAIEDPNATEYRISNLSPGELYFAVRIVTKSGVVSPYSNQVFAAVE